MSIITLRSSIPVGYHGSSTPVGYHVPLTLSPDADFERRWTAWQARGLAHDRLQRQRLFLVAIVASAIVLPAAVVFGLL